MGDPAFTPSTSILSHTPAHHGTTPVAHVTTVSHGRGTVHHPTAAISPHHTSGPSGWLAEDGGVWLFIITGVITAVVLVLLVLAIIILRYRYRYKGTYYTNESMDQDCNEKDPPETSNEEVP
ncbi:glycophorin-C [Chanos chanos]|uniref:Glycophorin-C n=1 Tax=Chanos chanos TaxID=29144 RepID=A0A6J2V436_CHACN|nr:glycophorin-C-like [Chanos chanos]